MAEPEEIEIPAFESLPDQEARFRKMVEQLPEGHEWVKVKREEDGGEPTSDT